MATIDTLATQLTDTYDIEASAALAAVVAWVEQLDNEYDVETGALTEDGLSIITAQAADAWGPAAETADPETADPETAEARDELRSAQAAVDAYEANLTRRDAAVRTALAAGIPVRNVVADTRLSRQRVYQIRDGRR